MARQLRLEYEGAIYHLKNRGDRREEIFREDLDRQNFFDMLGLSSPRPTGKCMPIAS